MGASRGPLPMLTKPSAGQAVAGEPRLRDADRPAHMGGQTTSVVTGGDGGKELQEAEASAFSAK